MSTSTLQDRVKLALQLSGKTKTDLWKGCGVSSSTVTTWVNGRNQSISGQNLIKAAGVLGVNPNWLARGEGSMTETPTMPASVSIPEIVTKNNAKWTKPPFKLSFNSNWINDQFGSSKINALRLYEISDDTMSPSLMVGDYVLVDTSVTSHDADGIYILNVEENHLIRRIQHKTNGIIAIKCDNPSYEVQSIANNQSKLKVVGKVLWAWAQRKI